MVHPVTSDKGKRDKRDREKGIVLALYFNGAAMLPGQVADTLGTHPGPVGQVMVELERRGVLKSSTREIKKDKRTRVCKVFELTEQGNVQARLLLLQSGMTDA